MSGVSVQERMAAAMERQADATEAQNAALAALVDALKARPVAGSSGGNGAAHSGPVFPNYGKSKGHAVAGASVGDLRYYGEGCIRSLENPEKQRFHDKERALLDAINAELVRQGQAPLAVPGAASEGRHRVLGTRHGRLRPPAAASASAAVGASAGGERWTESRRA
jgi:hypothetical protein